MEHAPLKAAAIVALSLLAGCAGGGATPAASAKTTTAANAAPADFDEGRWGKFHSARFELSIGLPDGHAWRIDDHRSPWLVATHAPTDSTLRVRTWSESELASNDRCLATARSWDASIPRLDAERPVDERQAPIRGSDMTAHVVADIRPDPTGAIGGYVVAVGASIRRCLLVVYTTRASGRDAPRVIGDRLATMVEGLAKTLAFDRSFDVPRERPR